MNGLHLAKSIFSPAYLRQGLSLSLALLVTLIVVQQFVHWMPAPQAAAINHLSPIHHAPFTPVAAPIVKGMALGFTPVQNQMVVKEVGELPQRQSWVF